MKFLKGFIPSTIAFLIVVSIVASLTNPSLSEHKDGVVEQIQQQVNNDLGDWGLFNGIRDWSFDKLGRGAISVTNRRNYLVFSVCDVTALGFPVGHSVGFMGLVTVFQGDWDESTAVEDHITVQ